MVPAIITRTPPTVPSNVMASIAAFDCNGNGRIDFADVVWLFNHF